MPEDLNAWATAKSTNTPTVVTTPCLTRRESGSLKMPEKPTPAPCPTSSCSAAVFPVKASAWPGQEGALATPEELCSLKLPDWLRPDTLRISSWKMYPVCLAIHGARPTRQSSIRWTDWGMVWNGNVLTAKISAFPSQETACTLSDILMSDVEEKYFLSSKQQEVLLFKPTAGTKENESTPPKD